MTSLSLSYAFTVAILWGTSFILIKATRTPSIYGLGIGLVGGVLSLLLPVLFFDITIFSPLAEPKIGLMIAFVGALRYIVGTWFFYESIKIGDVSVFMPVVSSKIIAVSILSVIIGIDTMNTLLAVAILLATAGFIIITLHVRDLEKLHRTNLIKSVVFALGTVLCWSGADIFVRQMKHIHPLVVTFGSLCFALLIYYVFIFSFKKTRMLFNMSAFDKKRHFMHGIVSFALAYFLLNLSLVKIGVIKTNIIISLRPIFASIVGYLFYKEKILFSKVCGAIILIISFILVTLSLM